MKKVISILIVILTLALLIVPASAAELDGTGATQYTFNILNTGVYEVIDAGSNVIDVVITEDFISFLDSEYFFYNTSEDKKIIGFSAYLFRKGYACMNYNEVAEYVSLYLDSRTIKDLYNEYSLYSISNNSATAEGFLEYIKSNNYTLYDNYYGYIHHFASEMYSLGASSSGSSSSGSHGSSSTVPNENKGSHYGASHTGGEDTIDSSCCYNPGYNDGLLDGADNFQKSDEYTNILEENSTQAIEEYLKSEEYTSAMESLKTEIEETAVQQYKEGDEYQGALDSAYTVGSENGVASAYEKAADEVFALGVAEGFNKFRESQECVNVMDSCYGQGWKDGENYANENAINPGGVIVTVVLLIAGSAVLLVLSKVKVKKKRK